MTKFCSVCRDAGKTESEYTSHYVRESRDPTSKVVCPTLLALKCPTCNKHGHTRKYCPLTKSKRELRSYYAPPKNHCVGGIYTKKKDGTKVLSGSLTMTRKAVGVTTTTTSSSSRTHIRPKMSSIFRNERPHGRIRPKTKLPTQSDGHATITQEKKWVKKQTGVGGHSTNRFRDLFISDESDSDDEPTEVVEMKKTKTPKRTPRPMCVKQSSQTKVSYARMLTKSFRPVSPAPSSVKMTVPPTVVVAQPPPIPTSVVTIPPTPSSTEQTMCECDASVDASAASESSIFVIDDDTPWGDLC